MPKLPSMVKIGDDWWKVLLSPIPDDPGRFGDCDHECRVIRIKHNIGVEMQVRTLAHEIAHASCPDLNEEAVLRLESALVSAGII